MHVWIFLYMYEKERERKGVEYYKYLSLLLKQKKYFCQERYENWLVKVNNEHVIENHFFPESC